MQGAERVQWTTDGIFDECIRKRVEFEKMHNDRNIDSMKKCIESEGASNIKISNKEEL